MKFSDLSNEDLKAIADNQLDKVSTEGLKVLAETPTVSMSPAGALMRGVVRGIVPTAAGLAAGAAGAVAGAPAGPGGSLAGAIGLGFAGSTAAAAGQQAALEAMPKVANFVGLSPEAQAVMARDYPYLSLIGESTVGLAGAQPTRALFGKGTQEAVRAARIQSGLGAGVNVGTEAAVEKLQGEDLDWKRLGLAGAFGAAGQKNTRVGEALASAGERLGRPIATRVTEPIRTAIRGPRPPEPATPPAPAVYPGSEELSPHVVNGRRLTNGEMDAMRGRTPTEPPPAEPARPAAEVPASDWHDTEASMNELLGRRPAEPVEPPAPREEPTAPRTETPRVEEAAPPTAPRTEAAGPGYTPDYTPFEGTKGLTHTFKTERGSTYGRYADRSTQRNRIGANQEDPVTGLQPKSGATLFMTPEAAERIRADFQNPDTPTILYPVGEDELAVIVTRDVGRLKEGQVLSMTRFSDEPKVGLTPVEVYDANSPVGNAGSDVHFGSKIVEVNPVSRGESFFQRSSTGEGGANKKPVEDYFEGVEKAEPSKYKAEQIQSMLKKGEKFSSLPYLYVDVDSSGNAKVTGHEGRHRARALADLGYTHIPVELRSNIRWSEQSNPQRFDYKENWPATLTGENGDVVPFPVSREEAGRNYGEEGKLKVKPTEEAPIASHPPAGVPVELNRPGAPFQDGMAFSPGVDRKIAGLARAFRKDLGIEADVYVTTMRDAHRDLAKFKEQYAKVAELASDPRNAGVVQQMPDGSWVMLLEDSASWAHRIETLAHEFGHIHEKEYFARQPKAVKDAIYGEFGAWLEDSGYRSAREHVESLRARKAGKMTGVPNPEKTGADLDDYWRKFEEWYADQVSRWATTSERPLTLVGQFFSRLAASMKRFYAKLRNAKYLPNSTFKEYMDGVHERHYPNGPAEMGGPSYSKKVAEGGLKKPVVNFKGEPIGAPTWKLSAPEKLLGFIKKGEGWTHAVDNTEDLKRAVRDIKAALPEGKKFNKAFDAYTKIALYRTRVAEILKSFNTNYIKEYQKAVKDAIKKTGITEEDVHNYLLAKHAPEANAHIRKLGGMQDGGSGMTDEAAAQFLHDLTPEKKEALEGLAKRTYRMLDETRKILVESRQETPETIAAWAKMWTDKDGVNRYIPLNRKEGELEFVRDYNGIQGSTAVKGSFTKSRKGSEKEVNNIADNVVLQFDRAVKRAEHNRVRQALAGLLLQHPNSEFGVYLNPDAIKDEMGAHKELTRLGVDPIEGAALAIRGAPMSNRLVKTETGPKVQLKLDPSKLNSQNVIPFRLDGKDRFIVMNANDPAAMRVAQMMKGADLQVLGPLFTSLSKYTRLNSSLNTSLSPVFATANFFRDFLGAPIMMNAPSVASVSDQKKKIMFNTFKAMKGLYQTINNPNASSYWADRARLWQESGGKTAFAPSFKGANQEAAVLVDAMKELNRGSARRAADAVIRGIGHFNDIMEGAIRVSAFDASLAKQMAEARVTKPTPEMLDEAALVSKEITINFDKRGSKTQHLSALYSFFASGIQGTAKLAEVLSGPAGKKIMAGGLALGAFQSLLLMLNDFDENQPSSYVRNKNFLLPIGGGKLVTIPLPIGLNILPSIGRMFTDTMFHSAGLITGTKSTGERIGDMAGIFLDAFNPLGGGTFLQTLAPTVLDPLVAVAENKDAFGRPISREDMPSRPTPGYKRSREDDTMMGKLANGIAEAINLATFGTEHQKGQWSPTADDIKYIAGQISGGAVREASKLKEFIANAMEGKETSSYKIPVVGRYMTDTTEKEAVAAQFYQNIKTMYGYKQEIQGRMKERQDVQEFLREKPEARLWAAAQTFENRNSELNKTRKEMVERGASPELIKRIDDTKTKIMNQFNELVRNAQR